MAQVRVQILLEQRQHTALKKAARRENKSVSEIIRQITDGYLAQTEPEQEDSVIQTLDRFRALREKQTTYEGDLTKEIRAERSAQQEKNL
ncbi:MAG: hypothetical protein JXA25_17755 [Anaerolineales bacterium]|nr:hypothetical protein [Anaerolineales bacterium]